MSRIPKNLSCKDYALYLISLRPQTVGQLQEKLKKKNYSAQDIKEAIERLLDLRYLDDQQFAEIYFENLKKYKNFGFYGIKNKLISKKLETKLVERLLKTLTLKEEIEIAKRLVEKSKRKTKEQITRSLQSKGFRLDAIFKAVAKIQENFEQ